MKIRISPLSGSIALALVLRLPASDAATTNVTNSAVVTNLTAAASPARTDTASATNKSSTAPSVAAEKISTNGPVALTFPSFRLISDRNIFNPNRSPKTRGGTVTANEVKKVLPSESIALGGTMSYTKGSLAFFVSTVPEYKKSLKPGETIVGYTVRSIAYDHVELEKEGAKVELKVGHSLRREEGGPWQLSAKTEPIPAPSSSPAAGADDALQRLLRKREKEMNP